MWTLIDFPICVGIINCDFIELTIFGYFLAFMQYSGFGDMAVAHDDRWNLMEQGPVLVSLFEEEFPWVRVR